MINLKEHESRLLSLKAEMVNRIDAIHQDTHHTNEPVEKDFAEQATQSENDDVLNTLDNETQQTIYMIDNALKSIADGTFGNCESCGKGINEKRLEAVPYTTLCIDCAEKAQKG